jgi:hypothetical protein
MFQLDLPRAVVGFVGVMISWLLDTAPEGALGLAWEQVPAGMRLLHRVWWRRRYVQRYGSLGERADVTALAGSLPAPLVRAA